MDQTQGQTRSSIWKYDLKHGKPIWLPAGAKVLSTAWQNGGLKLWAQVDKDVPKVERRVHLASTGHDVEEGWEFVGTVTVGRTRVYHIFLGPEGTAPEGAE